MGHFEGMCLVEISFLGATLSIVELYISYSSRPSTLQTAQNTYSKRLVEKENAMRRSSLPKALSSSAPETATRLSVFGTPDIINNLDETDMSESLNGIPVRLIKAKNLTEFRQKIELVSINES